MRRLLVALLAVAAACSRGPDLGQGGLELRSEDVFPRPPKRER